MFYGFDNVFIWAQIAGLIGILVSAISWQLKNSRNIIFCNVPSCLLWSIHFFLLSAPIGVILNAASMSKDSLLIFINEKYVRYVIFSFLIAIWGIGLCYFSIWYDVIPLIAGTIINLSLLQRDNRELVARGSVVGHSCWAIYCILVGSYMGLICCTFIVISAVIGMARHENWHLSQSPKQLLKLLIFIPLLPSKNSA